MIEYPFEYFEDEVREGFYVSSLVKRSWAAQLEILWLISDICDKHNLKWYADSGTLLGAVRHQGFIPWDDDVDIAMLRTDYDKFIEIVEQELPPGFILRSPYSETPFYELFSRIVHTGMTNVDDKPHELLHEFPFPAGVDIFPMDNISLNAEEEKARLQVLRGLGGVLHNLDKDENLSIEEAVREIEKWLNCSINRELPKRQQVYICMEKCAKAFKNKPATYVANIQWYMKEKNDKCHKSCFSEIITLPFENMSMRAPINYDEILKSEYGQYQTVVKAGGDHGYPYFNKYEDMIEEQQGEYIYRYKFNPDDISDDTRQHSDSLYSKTSKFVSMARKVADVVTAKLASNDLSGLEKVFQSCQTAAINTGEMIEGKMGYSTQTVACLESYCESVYQLYEALLNDSQGVNDALSDMNKTIAELEDYTDTEIKDFKEVVFLVYRSKYWDFYDSKWKQAVDAGYKVTVIPAPYYEVKADGSFGEMHCDIDGYPEYVEITSYESYDFEANHPDVIYIQNPYDRCNRVINLPPYYYAANLRNFTEELIYIPFFIIDEIDNALAKQTMNYFCKTPGVVCSDLVLVQSEQMRQSYIECLTELAGEEYRELWEKKIQVQ